MQIAGLKEINTREPSSVGFPVAQDRRGGRRMPGNTPAFKPQNQGEVVKTAASGGGRGKDRTPTVRGGQKDNEPEKGDTPNKLPEYIHLSPADKDIVWDFFANRLQNLLEERSKSIQQVNSEIEELVQIIPEITADSAQRPERARAYVTDFISTHGASMSIPQLGTPEYRRVEQALIILEKIDSQAHQEANKTWENRLLHLTTDIQEYSAKSFSEREDILWTAARLYMHGKISSDVWREIEKHYA